MIGMGTSQTGPNPEVLTVDECWKHLASSYIGRLAVIHGTTPEIFPVNFVPIERTLVFRTGPGTKLRSLLEGRPVAFETDGLNVYGTEVWSVVSRACPRLYRTVSWIWRWQTRTVNPGNLGSKNI